MKSLGSTQRGEEAVGVVATFGPDGQAEADETFHANVAAAGAEADRCAPKGETGEEDRLAEVQFEPLQGGANVVLLAVAIVVDAFTETNAAEVEAQDGKSEAGEDLHGVVDDLIVQGASAGRVRMADECGKGRVVAAGVEDGFEAAGGAEEVVDGADVRGVVGVRHSV